MMSELHKAFVAAQVEMPSVSADSTNPHYKSRFVSLDHLIAETRPILNRHGLAITQEPIELNGLPALQTTLLHISGECRSQIMPLLLAGQDMQKLGAAITYARRYAWTALLGIGEPDDDGEDASRAARSRSAPKPGPNVLNPYPAPTPKPDAAPVTGKQHEPAAATPPSDGGGLPITEPPTPMPPIATEGFETAKKGLAQLERWWVGLSKSEQRQLVPYKDTLKAVATEADDT